MPQNKFENKVQQRNLLDDLRLSLEKLLQGILENKKSLENQLSEIGTYINVRKGSKELTNMFTKLIEYYSKSLLSKIIRNQEIHPCKTRLLDR